MLAKYKFVIGILAIVFAIGFLMFTAVDQTKMYMITVDEYLTAGNAYAGETVRIAGKVKEDSMAWDAATRELQFVLSDMDGDGDVPVSYTGLLPDMFAEGRDVVVEGPSSSEATFVASTVLTSCPSKYEAEAGGHPSE